jgi:hypothetical protein
MVISAGTCYLIFFSNISSSMSQVDARISIFRGEVRSVAGATIASYGITDPDQADDFLLPGLTYIYPVDPIVSTPSLFVYVLTRNFRRPRSSKKTNHIATQQSRQPSEPRFLTAGMGKIFSGFANHPSLDQRSQRSQSPWSRCPPPR